MLNLIELSMCFIIGYIGYKICTKIPDHDPIGYRKPGTEPGGWTGAYIAVARKGSITVAFFENSIDYIGYPKKWKEVENHVNELIEDGWIEMTPEDIKQTSGM